MREHREGEDLRSVHWRSSARLRRRVAAQRALEADRRVVVSLDSPTSGSRAEREELLEARLASAVGTLLEAERCGAEVRVEVPRMPPKTLAGREEHDVVLRHLALFRLERT